MVTKIEWVKNPDGTQGDSLNLSFGCSQANCAVSHVCYAKALSPRFKHRCVDCGNFTPHLHIERLERIVHLVKPHGFFNSMGEPFDYAYSDEKIQAVLNLLGDVVNNRHRFYLLTKQAQRLPNFDFPPNVWLGVSVNIHAEVDRIEYLRQSNALMKFVSFEPLYQICYPKSLSGIQWVIIGSETCRGLPERLASAGAVKRMIEQARLYRCSVFLKNNLNYLKDPILNHDTTIEFTQEIPTPITGAV